MAMHNPPHPGGLVKRQCLEPLGPVRDAGRGGPGRHAPSALRTRERSHGSFGRYGDTSVQGVRLDPPRPGFGMQMAYDLWQARERGERIAVERFVAA